MKNTILSQCAERDRLMSMPYLVRHTSYNFDTLLSNRNIKLITGPRRVGKSTQALLMLKGKNFAYLNFDDNQLLEKWNEDLVMRILDEVYPHYDFLLLDEVQNIDKWDLWVSKLYRRGINMVITGSNAKMLSSEMATLLTGRYIEVRMLPFSLEETLEWNGLLSKNVTDYQIEKSHAIVDEYLHYGGYPESVTQRSITSNYLSTLFDAIVYKDIVRRHKIRNVGDLNNVALFLLTNFTNPMSYNDVAENLGLASVSTTKKFMNYLHEPFLFYFLPRYNNKLKIMKNAPQKIYVVDNGFVASKAFNLSENLGRLLENQVFIELLRRGYDTEKSLFYYRSKNNKEIDFVLRNGIHIECLVQVCYDLSSAKTEHREIKSLLECANELKCEELYIVTQSEKRTINIREHIIHVVPITEF